LAENSGRTIAQYQYLNDGSNMTASIAHGAIDNEISPFADYASVIYKANSITFTVSCGSHFQFPEGSELQWEAYGNLV
jgi:hypothetical protein